MNLDDLVHRAMLDAVADGGGAHDDARPSRPGSLDAIAAVVRNHAPLLGGREVAAVARRVEARMHGLGLLDDVFAIDGVTDVMVNGAGPVWIEADGVTRPTSVVLDHDAVTRLVERILHPLGLRADRRTPLVDARLADGSRVHIVMPPLAVDGPYVTIRRFARREVTLDSFTTPDVVTHLVAAVRHRRSIIVSGGTGAGKTTLLNALCHHLDPGERVVTIEDAAELRLPGDHVVRLESRRGNADGIEAVAIRELVRNALRMRPDRIVVGEVRGGEALDMIQAMNTGHDGSLSTLHANGPAQALRRLETMMLTGGVELPLRAIRDQIAGAVDLIVQVARTSTGTRRIQAVARVDQETVGVDATITLRPLVTDGVLVDRAPESDPPVRAWTDLAAGHRSTAPRTGTGSGAGTGTGTATGTGAGTGTATGTGTGTGAPPPDQVGVPAVER